MAPEVSLRLVHQFDAGVLSLYVDCRGPVVGDLAGLSEHLSDYLGPRLAPAADRARSQTGADASWGQLTAVAMGAWRAASEYLAAFWSGHSVRCVQVRSYRIKTSGPVSVYCGHDLHRKGEL